MFLINGYEGDCLSVRDRAIQFGDGVFTTARILDGCICLYELHLKRLQEACEKLFIPFTQWDILKSEMCSLAKTTSSGILKVIISRGSNGRGYSIDDCYKPSRVVSISRYPQNYYKNWQNLGITLTLSPVRLGCNPMLAGIKHLNRLEQVLIYIHLKRSGADEALVLDSEGIITECCTANIFWRQGYDVFTPLIKNAGVNGVMRQFFLTQLKSSSFHVSEVSFRQQALLNAEEVIICNSLMPIVPVRVYKNKVWTSRELYHFLFSLSV